MLVLEPEVIAEIENGNKIVAIKKLREIRGLGLKESKELIDLYSSQNKHKYSSSSPNPGASAKIALTVVFAAICYFVYKLVF